MKNLFLILILFIGSFGFSQSINNNTLDTLNNYNEKGKRHGYWVEYLNKELRLVKKEEASFYRYVYYDNGTYLSAPSGFSSKKMICKIDGDKPKKDTLVLLNGIYFLYTKKDKIESKAYYKKGLLVILIAYNVRTSVKSAMFDFTKHYNNQEYSYYIEEYDDKAVLNWSGFVAKKNEKWKRIPINHIP